MRLYKRTVRAGAVAPFIVLWAGFASVAAASASTSFPAGIGGFDENVKPFIKRYCVECHNPQKTKGKLTLHDLGGDVAVGADDKRWRAVLEAIDFGDMPPDDAEHRPADEKAAAVVAWITNELGATGGLDAMSDRPSQGNRINHEALFSGEHKGPAYSPSRLWRISPYISNKRYKKGALRKAGVTPSQPFGLTDEKGIRDYASLYRLDAPTLELLMINANAVVNAQIGPSPAALDEMDRVHLAAGKHPSRKPSKKTRGRLLKLAHAIAYSDAPPTPEQVTELVQTQCAMALSRPPTREEQQRYEKLLTESIRKGGNLVGVRAVLVTILMAPEAIYRMELGLGKQLTDGRRMLSAEELAFAIGYAINDTGPDKQLLADASSGKLLDRTVIAEHVGRLIDASIESYPGVRGGSPDDPPYIRFFQEYFGYTRAPEVFKDGSRHPGYTPRPVNLVEDTDTFVAAILREDKDVFRRLLTEDDVMIYTWGREHLWTHPAYGVSRADVKAVNSDKSIKRYRFRGRFDRAGQRVGILTQPAWLTAHSQNFDNDPVVRGKWIYERLLAGYIPDVPIEVDATIPADHDKSLRQRLEKTRDAACWKCHKKMDSYGLVFEAYDDVGRYRTAELLRDNKTTVPVDTTGAIIASGEPGLDGPVKNAAELMNKLANSDRARQSFIRYVFRYYMGRNETLNDSPTLIAAGRAFVESGGSMKALVVSLLTSDSFLYRKDQPRLDSP